MVTFDSADPGTAAATWRADPRFEALPMLPVDEVPSLVVLAAHADDETLGAGGLIALMRKRGVDVTIVVATDGAAGGVTDWDAGGVADGAARAAAGGAAAGSVASLRSVRAEEVDRAATVLGVARRPLLLGHPDGRVRESRATITRELTSIVASARPGTVIVAPWRGDGHRDHRVLGEIAASVAASAGLPLWEYPVWMWHWGDPTHPDVPWPFLVRLPLDDRARDAKGRGLGTYVSQTRGSGTRAPMLHTRFLEHFAASAEYFVVGAP